MRTLEFRASLNPDHTLTVPTELAAQLRPEEPVRVILVVPEVERGGEWGCLTAEQFLKGYADSDAIYDELPAG